MKRRVLLAGDVGGTKTNLALFAAHGTELESVTAATFQNHDHAGLEQIVAAFLSRSDDEAAAACFGVAGPVADGRIEMPNLGWRLDAKRLGETLGIARVVLLNDLEATSYGVDTLSADRFAVLNAGVPRSDANAALIAAGTGLGVAILFWDGARRRVSASEGGHADYAPRDAEQEGILGRLRARFGHVSWERLVSGPGLRNIYDALDVEEDPGVARSIAAAADASAAIAEAALARTSARCVRALDVFADCYGAAAGNLALHALAAGGVYIGGGIAPKILRKLEDGSLFRAFSDKGRLSPLLRDIPVKVILDPTTALRGAAAHLARLEEPP